MEARQNCWRFVQTCPSMEKFPPSFKSQPYGDCFVILASCDSVTIHVVKNVPSKQHSKTITNHHITKLCQSSLQLSKITTKIGLKKTSSPTGFLSLPHFLEQKQTSLGFFHQFFLATTKLDSNPGNSISKAAHPRLVRSAHEMMSSSSSVASSPRSQELES